MQHDSLSCYRIEDAYYLICPPNMTFALVAIAAGGDLGATRCSISLIGSEPNWTCSVCGSRRTWSAPSESMKRYLHHAWIDVRSASILANFILFNIVWERRPPVFVFSHVTTQTSSDIRLFCDSICSFPPGPWIEGKSN